MRLPVRFSKVKTHEEIFVEYYDWLVRWALHLSEELHENANDLVHDLYLQLIRTRPDLDTANDDSVRAYLYTMLHNLVISKARRSGHDPLSALSIVDYDSVEYGLASVDRNQLIFIRSDLARVCEYANRRKHSSRAASVLILRFFLSYYPSEIVRILQTSRVAVENHLRSARIEARAYLRRPQSLRFLGHDVTPTPAPQSLPDNPELLFLELRKRLFENNTGKCIQDEIIEARYGNACTPMEASELAHVVGCPRCLEKINVVLGLPRLATRFPADAIDRDSGGNEPPASGNGGNDLTLKRKIQDTYEHQPRKLQIAVDGEICAAQRVSLAHNELQVKLNPLEKPSFLEVFSDQGIRLLYLQLDNSVPDKLTPNHAMAELSDGRSIELQFSLSRGAAVACATYSDPYIPEFLDDEADVRAGRKAASTPVFASPDRVPLAQSVRSLVRRVRSLLSRRPRLLPLSIGVVLASIGIFVLQNTVRNTSPSIVPGMTAPELLAQSKAHEDARISAGGAVHSVFSLTTLSGTGAILDTQRVERWDSLHPKRSALRLLDKKGALIAGRWRDQQGKITHYVKGRVPQQDQAARQSDASFQNAWELIPGADVLSTWKGLEDQTTTNRTGNDNELRYERAAPRTGSGIVRASLVLDASSVQPIREDMVLDEGGTTREYRFERLTYEIVPASQLQDSDFLPQSELATIHSGLNGTADLAAQRTELMLSALELVDRFGPDAAEALDLERLPDGRVQLSGVVPTNQERDAIHRALMSLPANGQLLVALHSGEEPVEPAPRQKPVQAESTAPVPVEEERIPFDPTIRASLISQGLTGNDLEARIRKIASAAVNDVASVHRNAWSLRQIAAEDFSFYDLQKLRREDRMRWIALLNTHARSLQQHLALLSHDLSFLPSSPVSPAAPILPLGNSPELAQAAEGLNRDCERINRLLTAGLTLAPSGFPPRTSSADVAELLEQIENREKILSATVERLSSAL